MKKLHLHKLYTPRDVATLVSREENKVIALLEKEKTIGKKMMGFWYVRGEEVIKIQKLLKGIEKK